MATTPKIEAKPDVESQRDIALAVLVLVNDADLTSDEALDVLVERRVIHRRAAEVYRSRYFAVARSLEAVVDAVKLDRVS